ncbi:MAG: alanine--tRNA ligase [Thermoleophilia bacterium]|nr:alanine--tRNA ligase [Thermoleophilia bacterium]
MRAVRTTAEIREGFLSFFEEKGHLRCPSASLVPRADDRSTLLTTAGMQPQMPFFLGREAPPAPLTTSAQKCFRTPDIDEVGLDTYHLTFFEMLGNFSFGQYFKEGAIAYATEFIRERLRLDWDRIWVSVHAGDPELELGPDEAAIELWERIGMPPERIVPLPSSENFWSVGGPGPCGPDSEIYYDWGEEVGCGTPDCKPGCSRCERFLEFWNLVFMEYELHPDGTLTPLPKQNIDTGLGLERTARIVQQVPSVYDTDGYQTIMRWIAEQSGVAYGDSPDATKAHRVLADHGRGMTFLVGDGVTPSNEGRGYVLRRIIRRAVQHGLRIGMQGPFLAGLADAVIEQMGEAYPELVEHRREIHRVLTAEEERFGETLERGMRLFEEAAERARGGNLSGEDAFTLQATYGFPIELTQELARERGLGVDDDEYRRLMAEHREISRAGVAGGNAQRAAEFATAAGFRTEFVGYEKTDVRTQLGAVEELGDGLFLAKLRESPFYPAGGGQVTDAGWIEREDGTRAELREAYRFDGDQALLFEGSGFSAGDRVRAVVPWSVRYPTMANHTATHLLHKALQEVLGDHVRQAGSAVRPDKLRFDFTHPQALTPEERAEVERRVNERVFANLPVRIFETPLEEARKLGAMMLFGERYGDVVRVVDVDGWSIELCGGTHVRSTAEIGPFAILSESSVGAGVRRIEAVTAGEAFAYLRERAREADVLRDELERVRREAKRPRAEAAVEFEVVDRVDGVVLVSASGLRGGPLRDLSDRVRQQEGAEGAIVASVDDGRAYLVVNFAESLVGRGLDASKLVRELGRHIGGGGGGRPTLAEAGGKNAEGVRDALAAGKQAVEATLR